MQAVIKRIQFKPAKDEESEPTVEILLSSEDLKEAAELAWHIGKEVEANLEPHQSRLPLAIG